MSIPSGPMAVSHNQVGQKLGRKGQETRERILSAMLRLLDDPEGPPVTLTGVAKEARVRPPNFYLYFPDMGDLLLAALARVMATAEAAYLEQLRQRWPDATLRECCLAFLRAHYEFWQRNARILHMRNALADAGDLRVMRYRNEVTLPLLELLTQQMEGEGEAPNGGSGNVATVLLTGVERVATVTTNPNFRLMRETSDADSDAHVQALLAAEAEVMALAIAHRRALARELPQRRTASG